MAFRRHLEIAALVLACAGMAACGDDDAGAMRDAGGDGHPHETDAGDAGGTNAADGPLCKKYGGKDAVGMVIAKHVVPSILGDCRLNGFFAGLPSEHATRLVDCLSIQAEELFGCAGVKYEGSMSTNGLPCRSMKEAHADMGVAKGDFDALIEDVVSGLSEAGVEQADIEAAAPALLQLKGDIVEKTETDPTRAMCVDDAGVGDAG